MLMSSPPIEVSCMPILYTHTNLPSMCMSRQEWTGSKVRLVFVISSWHWTMGSTLQQQLQHTHVVQQRDSVVPITVLKTVTICGDHYLWNHPFWIIAILEDLDSGQQGLCITFHYFPKTHTSIWKHIQRVDYGVLFQIWILNKLEYLSRILLRASRDPGDSIAFSSSSTFLCRLSLSCSAACRSLSATSSRERQHCSSSSRLCNCRRG